MQDEMVSSGLWTYETLKHWEKINEFWKFFFNLYYILDSLIIL